MSRLWKVLEDIPPTSSPRNFLFARKQKRYQSDLKAHISCLIRVFDERNFSKALGFSFCTNLVGISTISGFLDDGAWGDSLASPFPGSGPSLLPTTSLVHQIRVGQVEEALEVPLNSLHSSGMTHISISN
jgi:hypothetical protein